MKVLLRRMPRRISTGKMSRFKTEMGIAAFTANTEACTEVGRCVACLPVEEEKEDKEDEEGEKNNRGLNDRCRAVPENS